MDSYQPVEQAGFHKRYSTSDHLLTMRTLTEKANEYHLPLFLAFVDYEKAFDSIGRSYEQQQNRLPIQTDNTEHIICKCNNDDTART